MMRSGENHQRKKRHRLKAELGPNPIEVVPHDPFARDIDQTPVKVSGPTGCMAREGEPGHDGRASATGNHPRLEDKCRQGPPPRLLNKPGGNDPRACDQHGIFVARQFV